MQPPRQTETQLLGVVDAIFPRQLLYQAFVELLVIILIHVIAEWRCSLSAGRDTPIDRLSQINLLVSPFKVL